MLDEIQKKNALKAKGVFGLFKANSTQNSISVYSENNKKLGTINTLRQQIKKKNGIPNLALSDFIAPESSKITDYIGCFCVTSGIGVEDLVAFYESEHDDYNSILVKSIADRLAEAFAEYLHVKIRTDYWGYSANENLSNSDLIQEKYQGIRPAPGYPACPDHSEKMEIWKLLNVENNIGVKLTESFAMWPAASVSGYYFGINKAKYFGVGKIKKDQLTVYAKEKNVSDTKIEKLLQHFLIE